MGAKRIDVHGLPDGTVRRIDAVRYDTRFAAPRAG